MGPWISLVGMATLIAVGVVLSKDRRAIHLRTVGAAFALLVSVAALVLFVPQGKAMLHTIGAGVQWVINYSYSGISFLFGDLATDKVGFVFALHAMGGADYRRYFPAHHWDPAGGVILRGRQHFCQPGRSAVGGAALYPFHQ